MIITIIRKPINSPLIENSKQYQCGGLNIDSCRIDIQSDDDLSRNNKVKSSFQSSGGKNLALLRKEQGLKPKGRWPANVVLSPVTCETMNTQSGISVSSGGRIGNKDGIWGRYGIEGFTKEYSKGDPGFGDVGGASRYFKCIMRINNEN